MLQHLLGNILRRALLQQAGCQVDITQAGGTLQHPPVGLLVEGGLGALGHHQQQTQHVVGGDGSADLRQGTFQVMCQLAGCWSGAVTQQALTPLGQHELGGLVDLVCHRLPIRSCPAG